jgi:sugar phosphate isomerase/epimerase
MNLSVSQLSHPDLKSLLQFLSSIEINNIELVLSKIKPWDSLTFDDIVQLKNELDSYGIQSPSCQSLFFGLTYKLEDVDQIVNHLKRLIEYSKYLGIRKLVFGSPNLRKRVPGYESLLKNIFEEVDFSLKGTEIDLVIEPNCKVYKGEFFHTVPEIVQFLDKYSFTNIVTMIDYHNVIEEGMDPNRVLEDYKTYISHIHISEPGLISIKNEEQHKEFSQSLKRLRYSGIVTYEVLHNPNIFEDIKTYKKLYK